MVRGGVVVPELELQLKERIKNECAQIRTVGDLERYAQSLPAPIGILFLDAIKYFSTRCTKIVDGLEKTDWKEVSKRRKFGSSFIWTGETVITKDMFWPLADYILSLKEYRSLTENIFAATITQKEGYGSSPARVILEIETNIRDNAPYLTEEYVRKHIEKARSIDPTYHWGKGEFRNHVFENLVKKYNLPFIKTEVGLIPSWKNHNVQALHQEFQHYSYLF